MSGRMINGVRRSLLAAAAGAGITGFSWAAAPAGVDKVDWALQTATRGVNVLRYIPPAEWPAIFARTSTTDISGYVATAIAGGVTNLYFPQGKYRWATARTIAWSGSPVRIEGDQAVSSVDTGTTIEQTNAGAAITYTGAGTLTGFAARHLRFKYIGADVKAQALCLSNGYINTIEHCVFEAYAHKGAGNDRSAGLYFTALTGFPPILSVIRRNEFVGCCEGMLFDKADSNANYILYNRFKSCTGWGLRLGDFAASSFAVFNVVVRGNDFEGNTDGDIGSSGGGRGLVIEENYFEFAAVRPPVVLLTNVSTPIYNSVSVQKNVFVGDPGAGRGMCEAQALDDFVFDGNVIANNLGKTRYGLKNSSTGSPWKNVRARMMSTPSGQTAPTTVNDGYTDRDVAWYDSSTAWQNWVPVVTFGGASTGIVLSTAYGEVVDDGQYVTAAFRIAFSNKGSATGTMEIGGLSVPNTSNGSLCFTGSGAMASFAGMSGLTGAIVPGMAAANATSFRLYMQGATQTTSLTDANVTNATVINGWVRYRK